jgi:lipid-binding SYLF domain-containing protein
VAAVIDYAPCELKIRRCELRTVNLVLRRFLRKCDSLVIYYLLLSLLLLSVAANHVLEQALAPGSNGVPKSLFSKDLKGIVLISVVEVGFIFSGNVGTGILMARDSGTNAWSPPCAVGLTGVGWGFLVGGSLKDLMIFMYNEETLGGVTGESGLKLGGQAELTLGPFGRSAQLHLDVSSRGAGATVAVAFSKGAFLGVSVEGSVVGPRHAVNETFYGMACNPDDILNKQFAVKIPEDKVTLIQDVYDKLKKLGAGETHEPDAMEEEKKAAAKEAADKAAEVANVAADVVQVDAAVEAAKEASF